MDSGSHLALSFVHISERHPGDETAMTKALPASVLVASKKPLII
jgi:hypothetical protein